MIEIDEAFEVPASPAEVYGVLADPSAVVECVPGASLGDQRDDGAFDGAITIKFGGLRVRFTGTVSLDLDPDRLAGTLTARGKDGQGGTRFAASAGFEVHEQGAVSRVVAKGDVRLTGGLSTMIEGAAGNVVRRMTDDFTQALAVRCASSSTHLGAARDSGSQPGPDDTGAPAPRAAPSPARGVDVGILLLHGIAGSPATVRAWGDALASSLGAAVSIPRLPGHGTRWQELARTGWRDWYGAAEAELASLADRHERVVVMGISLGATLALRLAETAPDRVAGVVAVNPVARTLEVAPKFPRLVGLVRRSVRAVRNDAARAGVTEVAYDRVPLRALRSLQELAVLTRAHLGDVASPVLLVSSRVDHVVPPQDGDLLWAGLDHRRDRRITLDHSYHLVPVDDDGPLLFDSANSFVQRVVERSGAEGKGDQQCR